MLNIQQKESPRGMPWLRLGFRPFFLGAAVYAMLSVGIWMAITLFDAAPALNGLTPTTWHAHEMLFGYAFAVIAGFLLTAVKNWTGQQTPRGGVLLFMFSLWAVARGLPLVEADIPLSVMALLDLLFMLTLIAATALPVLKVKQYSQLGIISKLMLMFLSNALFYLGAMGLVTEGVQWGLYSGLYLIVALMLVMGRRVIPFFIEKGADTGVVVKNWQWVDVTSLVLLLVLWLLDVFTDYIVAVSVIAAMLFIVHVIRMVGWYTNSLWKKPLLWVLYLAYAFIVSGFLLKATEYRLQISPYLSVHAFAYGGIGVMTIGMMSRVILGHTGRNVFEPPTILPLCFGLLIAGAAARVLVPLFDMEHYMRWIAVSQFLWIAAFLVFLIVYAPMLLRPRVDGRDG